MAGMKNSHLCIPHSSLSEEGTSANVWWIVLRPPSLRTNVSTETKSWTAVFPSITHQAPHLCLHTHWLLRLWHVPLPTCLLLPHEVWSPSLPHNSHTHTHARMHMQPPNSFFDILSPPFSYLEEWSPLPGYMHHQELPNMIFWNVEKKCLDFWGLFKSHHSKLSCSAICFNMLVIYCSCCSC